MTNFYRMHQGIHSRWGILGGTLTSVLGNLPVSDVLNTVVLAVLGAAVSYLVSWVLKRVFPGK